MLFVVTCRSDAKPRWPSLSFPVAPWRSAAPGSPPPKGTPPQQAAENSAARFGYGPGFPGLVMGVPARRSPAEGSPGFFVISVAFEAGSEGIT